MSVRFYGYFQMEIFHHHYKNIQSQCPPTINLTHIDRDCFIFAKLNHRTNKWFLIIAFNSIEWY